MTVARPHLLSLSLALLLSACAEAPFPSPDELDALRSLHSAPTKPPPDPTNRFADDPDAAALGKRLFDDQGLSACGNVSCASCHGGEGFTVAEPTAKGCYDQRTGRNAPTVLNAGYSDFYMWDGRADSLWSQALLPLTSPIEMASTPELLRARLSEGYASEYAALFGVPISETADDALLANFGKVVAAFERTVNRTRAPFDGEVKRFLVAAEAGRAEEDPAYLGLKTFVRKGQCIACHKGPLLSDGKFHNVGLADPSPGRRGASEALPQMLAWKFSVEGEHSDDPGGLATNRLTNLRRELSEKAAEFEGAFRTPSLRNVALTAPYGHTGELATLEDVIDFYDKGGDDEGTFVGVKTETIVKLQLTKEEKAALLKLLESMTGEK